MTQTYFGRQLKGLTIALSLLLVSGCQISVEIDPSEKSELSQMHERLLVMDSHLDTPAVLIRRNFNILNRHDPLLDYSQVDYPRMVEGGLDGGYWVIFSRQGPVTIEGFQVSRDIAILRALAIHKMVAANPDKFTLATKAADAEAIHAAGKRIVYISIENAYPLGEDISMAKTFYDLGVRMIGPVHFANNQFADSSTDRDGPEWNGLSPLGIELINEANRLGMIVDASHASDEATRQMIELSKTPIVLSHSGANEVFGHPRNVPDDILLKLRETGGVIQMNAFSSYLTVLPAAPERLKAYRALNLEIRAVKDPTPEQQAMFMDKRRVIDTQFPKPLATFDQYMDHFIYTLNLIGPDHVGVSGDFDGGGGVADMNDITGFPAITERLLTEGYTEEDIAKIWGGNLVRLLAEAEAYAANPEIETASSN